MTIKKKTSRLPKGEDIKAGQSQRLAPNALDEYYYQVAVEYPKYTQCQILDKAIELAGSESVATKQWANMIHGRLRERIAIATRNAADDLKRLCVSELEDLIRNAESESVKLGAIIHGSKDLFPNVSIKKEQSLAEIESELESVKKELGEERVH